MMESLCPCCIPAYFLFQLFGVSLTLYFSIRFLTRNNTNALWKWIVLSFHTLFFVVMTITLGLHASNDARAFIFARIYFLIANLDIVDPVRQDLLSGLYGRILEIGPGPGANFKYFINNTAITEWVGVEPNTYFQQKQTEIIDELNLTFKTSTVWMKGESKMLDVEPESFDYVVGTHVLCSVDDVADVLTQVKRALKPSGQYKFYEHVLTDSDDIIRWYQQLFAPIFYYLGNGCKFRELWKDIDKHVSKEMLVEMDHLFADGPIPVLRPHIVGSATKK